MSWERNIVVISKDEIAIMREAGRINANALGAVRGLICPGVTTGELDAAAEEVIRKHGAIPTFKGVPGAYPYPATITVSINDELVHGILIDRATLPLSICDCNQYDGDKHQRCG